MKGEYIPTVSLLIAARNEERVIGQKIENSLALDYPFKKLQIIIVSDASQDHTDDIVSKYFSKGVLLNKVKDGKGKINALNATFPLTTGEILVISDADSEYKPDALRKLVRNFADPEVGAVTGEEIRKPTANGLGLGEGYYVKLDNRIKHLEGMIGSMVMVNGGFFAIRRELYPILEPHLIHDSIVPCMLKLSGYRTAYEPEAVSYEEYAMDTKGDFNRRIRTVIQAFYSYLSIKEALNPLRTGFFAFEVWSHRFSRWFIFPLLILALVSNIFLADEADYYRWLLTLQIICYSFAGIGLLLDQRGIRLKVFYIPYYFLYIHLAAFWAVLQGIFGKRVEAWQPTKRLVS